MRSKRWILSVTGVLALSPLLAACGDDDPEEQANDPATSPASEEPSETLATPTESVDPVETSPTESETTAAGLPAACDVIAPIDVATAYGATPGEGSIGGGGYSENDVEWQTDNCDFEAEDFFELELALAGPDDFPAGFTCPPQTDVASTVKKVKVPGADTASWEVSDGPPFEGSLRVCTADYVFDLTLEFEDGYQHEGDPQMQTIGLAQVVVGKLG